MFLRFHVSFLPNAEKSAKVIVARSYIQQKTPYNRLSYKTVRIAWDLSLGAPEGTRTPDLLIRSQTLYPAELPAHILLAFSPENVFYYSAGGGESQAVFQKNSKKSANGHLYRKFAAKRAAFRLFVVAGSATEN